MSLVKFREIKLTLRLALPLTAAFLAQKAMAFVDTVMMGWIGPQALAAGALGTSIFLTILVFCRGSLSAIGIFVARSRGAKQNSEIKSHLQHGLCLSLLLSLPGMLLIWFSPYVLSAAGEDPIVIANTELLLHGLVWGFPGFLLFFVFRELIAAFELSRIIMLVSLGSIPLTFAANYVFIYGKYGLPALGIAGIGYASSIIMWFMFLCLFFYSVKHRLLKDHVLLKRFQLNRHALYEMFYSGAPTGVIFVLDVGTFLMAAMMMGYFGINALASYQIAIQCVSIAFNIPMALSVVVGLQVGQAVGSKDLTQVKSAAYINLGIGVGASAVIAVILFFFPHFIIPLFLTAHDNYEAIAQSAMTFLAIAALFLCLDAMQVILNGILRGFKDTLVPMLLSMGCYWFLGLGSAYYFAFYTSLGASGIWYGLSLGICSVGVLLMLRFLQRLKREAIIAPAHNIPHHADRLG